ncbi:MAG: hypothetical protein AB1861_30270 [Cyanobacteriota bacterium]
MQFCHVVAGWLPNDLDADAISTIVLQQDAIATGSGFFLSGRAI